MVIRIKQWLIELEMYRIRLQSNNSRADVFGRLFFSSRSKQNVEGCRQDGKMSPHLFLNSVFFWKKKHSCFASLTCQQFEVQQIVCMKSNPIRNFKLKKAVFNADEKDYLLFMKYCGFLEKS